VPHFQLFISNTETTLYTEMGNTITFDETNVATSRYMMSSQDSTHCMILLKYMITNAINELRHNASFTKCSNVEAQLCSLYNRFSRSFRPFVSGMEELSGRQTPKRNRNQHVSIVFPSQVFKVQFSHRMYDLLSSLSILSLFLSLSLFLFLSHIYAHDCMLESRTHIR